MNKELIAKLLAFMNEHKVSQTDVAKGIGKSVAAVNQWLQGKYAGDTTAINILVSGYLEREQAKRVLPKLQEVFVPTSTATNIMNLLEAVRGTGELGVLYGGAGLGKTTALREYAAKNPDTVLIETLMTYTPSVLLKIIARSINTPVTGNLNDINEAIIARLSGSGRLIIVDEAENLSTRSLEILRHIRDKANVGLVLVGMPRLLVNLCGKRGELSQLFNRAGYTLPLGEKIPDEQLAQILKQHLPDVDNAVCEAILKEAHGVPRRLWKLMFHTDRICKAFKCQPSLEMVGKVKEMLIGYRQ